MNPLRRDRRLELRRDLQRTRPIRRAAAPEAHTRPSRRSPSVEDRLNVPREARFWVQVPKLTKISLVVLAYLIVVLAFLALARSARIPVTLQDVRGWFTRPTPTLSETLTPTPASTLPPTPTYLPTLAWLRANANTPILSDPQSGAATLAILETGETAVVVGVSADQQFWAIQVPYFESGQGWVSASDVLVQNASQVDVVGGAIGDPQALSTEQRPMLVTNTTVNVRKFPDMNSPRMDVLEPNAIVPALGKSEDGEWFSIQMPGYTAWVSKDYVTPRNAQNIPVVTPAPAASNPGVPAPEADQPSLMASWSVNLRAGPGREYQVVGTLQQGQIATVVGVSEDGNWWAIAYPAAANGRAWVAADYVQVKHVEGVDVLK